MGFSALTGITAVGINVATGFADNNADFTIDYSGTGQHIAYIEDLYDLNATDLSAAVNAKFSAVAAHVDLAAGSGATGQLVWTFASATSGIFALPEAGLARHSKSESSNILRCKAMAVGNGTSPGVNNKTVDYLASKKGSRFGAILYDYYGSDARLGPATLGWDLTSYSNRCLTLFVVHFSILTRRLVHHPTPTNLEGL
jgi:1-phosphatidylinositol phosphodiesterase